MEEDIGAWLGRLGLERYAGVFVANDIDLRALPHLDRDDLKELGVSLGHRKIILAAFADWLRERNAGAGAPEEGAAAAPPAEAGAGAAKDAERRHLTVMFVDLVGSTALSARLDPEDLRQVITGYQNAVAAVVARFEGHVAKYMGDGVLCYFGWPQAHEDDAERAVRAGLALSQDVGAMTGPAGVALAARAGIASGLVVVGDLIGEGAAQEEAVVGDTPNLAARIQALAAPGQVVLAEATRRLIGEVFELADLGAHGLKGIDGKTQIYGVRGERAVESRFEARSSGAVSAMVGRDHELGLILERWRQAKAGEGQLVLLSGEAGIGKSRITRAMVDVLAAERHIRLSFQCSPYHRDSALYPVVQQLAYAAGIGPADSNEDKLDKLEARLVAGNAALIAGLLGLETTARYGPTTLSPHEQRRRGLEALAGQLMGLARQRPVLFIMEDAHWIDATTLELVDLCLDQVAEARVLMLITARPNLVHGFGGHPIVSRLALNRLGREQITAIVAKLTGGKALPAELMEVIVSKTDGVPLFVEELTKTVLESGQLEDRGGDLALTGPFSRLAIPATLHDSLMARLDRLQPVKEVAQMAACIGREFEYRLLKAISTLGDGALEAALDRLIDAELIFRRGLPPAASYIFKHALVSDAAYESLLKTRRQAIHKSLLRVLEAEAGTRPEILAHHAGHAGLKDAAIGYWRAAGDAALAQPAYLEAITHYTSAIALIGEMEDEAAWQRRELELQLQLAQALIAKRGYAAEATAEAFARAADLVEATGKTALRMPVYYGTWVGHFLRGEHQRNLHTAQKIAEEADRQGDTVERLVAHRLLGTTILALGRPAESRRHLEIALGLYRPREHKDLAKHFGQDPAVSARAYLSIGLWVLGHLDQAAEQARAMEEAAAELAHVNTVCWTAIHLAIYALLCRDDALLQRSVATLDSVSSQHGMELWRTYCDFPLGLLESRRGDASGLVRFRRADATYTGQGQRLFMPIFLVAQVSELHRLGRHEDALNSVRKTKEIIEATGESWPKAELHRLEGEVKTALSRPDQAENAFLRALEISRVQKAKSWERRAATSLARLWAARGERQAALDLLQPLQDWFAEETASPDHDDAETLLARLRR